MKTVWFIRHGATAGNLERRYIGRTDEELCQLGIQQAMAITPPQVDMLFVSPMLRTRQTAALVFPHQVQIIADDLRETDFGIFEAKTADELAENAAYRAWVDANCETPIPAAKQSATSRPAASAPSCRPWSRFPTVRPPPSSSTADASWPFWKP